MTPDIFENEFTVKVFQLDHGNLELTALGSKVTDYEIKGDQLFLTHKISTDVIQDLSKLKEGFRLLILINHGSLTTYTRSLAVTFSHSRCDKCTKYSSDPLKFVLKATIESDVHV